MHTFSIVRVCRRFREILCLLVLPWTFLSAACHDPVTGPKEDRMRSGSWGGNDAGLEVSETGAIVKFSCGGGRIDQPLLLDSQKRFDVTRVRWGKLGPEEPAQYSGRVEGNRMSFSVRPAAAEHWPGDFTLTFGITHPGSMCR